MATVGLPAAAHGRGKSRMAGSGAAPGQGRRRATAARDGLARSACAKAAA